jgi:hypothetical protein
MNLIEGLYPFEFALAVLGALLFFVLIFAFLFLLLRSRPIGPVLPFFGIPLVMIGYPGIKSFQYKDGVVSIERATRTLEQDPQNAAARAELQTKVAEIQARPAADASTATAIARGMFTLGDSAGAAKRLEAVLEKAPDATDARDLKKQIEAAQSLDTLVSEVQRNPGDPAAKSKLESTVALVTSQPVANPDALAAVARARAAIAIRPETAVISPAPAAAVPSRDAVDPGRRIVPRRGSFAPGPDTLGRAVQPTP